MHTARSLSYRGGRPPDRDPLKGTWDQRQRLTPFSWTDRQTQTDTCEDITLPQTSFAGGNEGLCLNSGYTLRCWAPDNLFLDCIDIVFLTELWLLPLTVRLFNLSL